jgi:hypothetical protein
VPLLAPFAAIASARAGPAAALATWSRCAVVINLPPLLQHPTPVATYVTNLPWPEVPEARPALPLLRHARTASAAGRPWCRSRASSASRPPTRGGSTCGSGEDHLEDAGLRDRLARARRGSDARPDLVPAARGRRVARQVAPPPRLGFLGRSLTGTGGPYATVYLDALLDQVVRANQQGRSTARSTLSRGGCPPPDGEAAAWRLETLRRAGRRSRPRRAALLPERPRASR